MTQATATTLKVATKSQPASVAGSIVATMRESETTSVDIQVVGAGALNQAIKAIAIARGFLAPSGRDLVCTPSFEDIEIGGEERTAMLLSVTEVKR